MIEQMVENVVDFSCMYAKHRESDTLEKEDVTFAINRLFPDISRVPKVKDD
jgi:transcription initiation factor TFIID subunit TAF12